MNHDDEDHLEDVAEEGYDVKDVKSSCEKDNCKSTKLVPNSKNNEKNNVDFKSLSGNENTSADIMNPFSGNIFEFQKLFAAQMLMLENHKRLLQLPEENANGHKNSQTSLKEEPLEKNPFTLSDLEMKDFQSRNLKLSVKEHLEGKQPRDSSRNGGTVHSKFTESNGEDNKCFLENARCYLETKELWQKFHRLGTEMIITKTGR